MKCLQTSDALIKRSDAIPVTLLRANEYLLYLRRMVMRYRTAIIFQPKLHSPDNEFFWYRKLGMLLLTLPVSDTN